MVAIVPFPMILSTMALSLIGLFGNCVIVISTIRFKKLRHRCGLLICLQATVEAVICLYLVQLRVFMLFEYYQMPNTHCFLWSIHGVIAFNIQAPMGVILGLDRLLAVTIPMKYGRIPMSYYVYMVLCAVAFSIFMTVSGFIDSNPKVITAVCMPPTAFNSWSRMGWVGSNFAIAIVVIVIYSFAQHRGKKLGKSEHLGESTIQSTKRLLISLTIIMSVYACTWFLTVLALLVIQVFLPGTFFARQLEQQLAWLVIINSSTSFFVYLWRAPEYRKRFISVILCRKMSGGMCSTQVTASVASIRKLSVSTRHK